jgi:hypothetical protein
MSCILSFLTWLSEQSGLQIPQIPAGSMRLTHFTSPRTAQTLLSGQDFQYGGLLSSTTDGFSSNQEVISLIQTGKTSAYERDSFGTAVVLMDIPNSEYRAYDNFNNDINAVPNDRIVGVVDRETMQFTPNPKYKSKPLPLQITNRTSEPQRLGANKNSFVPMPGPSSNQANVDIW